MKTINRFFNITVDRTVDIVKINKFIDNLYNKSQPNKDLEFEKKSDEYAFAIVLNILNNSNKFKEENINDNMIIINKLIDTGKPSKYNGPSYFYFMTDDYKDAFNINRLSGGNNKYKYLNRYYKIRIGKKGGKYILVNKKKIYISKNL
jgi:hypothetical protein